MGSATGSGSDVADFMLGIPDGSAIAYGNADKYLRQSVYAAYLNDDWRVSPQLTVNAGVRWEYGAPVTETKNRLVNLDVASGYTDDSAGGRVQSDRAIDRPDLSDVADISGQEWF